MPPHALSLAPLLRGALCLLVLAAGSAQAHRVTSASLAVNIDTKAATYLLDAAMEVVPSEDAAVNEQISPEDAAREFAAYLNVLFDESQQKPELAISVEETSDADTPPELRRQQVLTRFSGKIPDGAKEFLLYLDPRCPMAVVMVVIKDQQPSRRMQVILAGEYSRPVSVAPVVEQDPFTEGAAAPAVGAPAPGAPAPSSSKAEVPAEEAMPTAVAATAASPEPATSPLAAGFRAFFQDSLLPVLLVAGVLLLTLGRETVFFQMACLLVTLGLSLTLSAWSLVPVPDWAPTLLAGLTAGIAGEALFHRRVRAWRYPLLVLAGLALGATLAAGSLYRGVFGGSDPATGRVIAFLTGVEAAFLLTGLAAAAMLLPLSRFAWYRKSVVTPVAVGIVGYAIFRIVEGTV